MQALPLPKTESLMNRINALQVDTPYYVDVSDLSATSREARSIRRQIEGLFEVDACAAWEVMGAWKALVGDWQGVTDAFRNSQAIGWSGSNRINLAVNCINLGMFSASQQTCADLGEDGITFVEAAVALTFECGAVSMSLEYARKAENMQKNLGGIAANVAAANEIFARAGFTQERIARHLDVAGEVLRRHRIRPQVEPRVTVAKGFFEGVTYAMLVPVSTREAFDMNMELAMAEDDAGIHRDFAVDVAFESAVA